MWSLQVRGASNWIVPESAVRLRICCCNSAVEHDTWTWSDESIEMSSTGLTPAACRVVSSSRPEDGSRSGISESRLKTRSAEYHAVAGALRICEELDLGNKYIGLAGQRRQIYAMQDSIM